MILFINGPFGVGKTSATRVLVEETPDAMLYDPEVIGSILRRVLGPIKTRTTRSGASWSSRWRAC